jgi:hypothetical protein
MDSRPGDICFRLPGLIALVTHVRSLSAIQFRKKTIRKKFAKQPHHPHSGVESAKVKLVDGPDSEKLVDGPDSELFLDRWKAGPLKTTPADSCSQNKL